MTHGIIVHPRGMTHGMIAMWCSKLGLMAHLELSVKCRIKKERKIKEKMGMRQVAR